MPVQEKDCAVLTAIDAGLLRGRPATVTMPIRHFTSGSTTGRVSPLDDARSCRRFAQKLTER